jgi:hypothetical protein
MAAQITSISIYLPSGEEFATVDIGGEAEKVSELMKSDYIQLDWNDVAGTTIDAGAWITWAGQKYKLLEPYIPEQVDERQWRYRPKFQAKSMCWAKVPYFHYNDSEANPAKEPDWSLTGTASAHILSICAALEREGEGTYTAEVDTSFDGTETIEFTSTDILSALSSVATTFDGEWLVDEASATIYFMKRIYIGDSIALTVGENVGVPSLSESKTSYYNVFYPYGSTRNITQDVQGANVNTLINKRLTLNPDIYPNGCIDTREDPAKEPAYTKFLTYEDIYPSAHLQISDDDNGLRARLMYRLDDSDNPSPLVIGTNADGSPIYDQYVVWYFRAKYTDTGEEFTIKDPTTYSEDNPTGELISGKTLSVQFTDGLLNGREFELRYISTEETLAGQTFPSLGIEAPDFKTYPGDFEIKHIEDGTLIIPTMVTGGIHPQVGDGLKLFNLRMPAEYTTSAQTDLETEAMKTIDEEYRVDLNNYTVKSNQPLFAEGGGPKLAIGQSVRYTNGSYRYDTRVIKLTIALDSVNLCEQEVVLGNDKVKGSTTTLKETVESINRNVETIAAVNSLTESLQQSYARTQQIMLDGFRRIGNMWKFDENRTNTIYSPYNVYSTKSVSALGYAESSGEDGSGDGASSEELEAVKADVATNKQDISELREIATNVSGAVEIATNGVATNAQAIEEVRATAEAASNGADTALEKIEALGDSVDSNTDSIAAVKTTAEAASSKADSAFSTASTAYLTATALKDSKGKADGIATLDSEGLIPASELPPDNIVYFYEVGGVEVQSGKFTAFDTKVYKTDLCYNDEDYRFYLRVVAISSGEAAYYGSWTGADDFGPLDGDGRIPSRNRDIYVSRSSECVYRWAGDELTLIGTTLALGYTSATAFPGDKGKELQSSVADASAAATAAQSTADTASAATTTLSNRCTALESDVATLKAASSDAELSALYGNVFIHYHNQWSEPTMARLSNWAALAKAGMVADGVLLVSDGRYIVIAPDEPSTMTFGTADTVWSGGGKALATAVLDYNGESNTATLSENDSYNGEEYAAGYCHSYSHGGISAGNWWLPSLGELLIICANIEKINYALALIGGTALAYGSSDIYVSSTEQGGWYQWGIQPISLYSLKRRKTTTYNRVRPITTIYRT